MHDSGPLSSEAPLVSICGIAFNHEPFIRDALNGFVCQKADFRFEIVIHDDASTDATPRIIEEFRQRYPHLIRVIRQQENQYSQGKSVLGLMFPAIRGRYLALCECDDFWTDPHKIARQASVLDETPSVDLCACQTELHAYDEQGGFEAAPDTTMPGHYSLGDVLGKNGIRVRTASLMIRREAFEEYLSVADLRDEKDVEDRYLQFFGAKRGGLEYVGPTMAAYRYRSPGSWSQKRGNARDKVVKNRAKVRNLMMLDEVTGHHHQAEINTSIAQAIGFVVRSAEIPYADRLAFLREAGHRLRLATRLRLWAALRRSQLHGG